MIFERYEKNPIMKPELSVLWRSKAVFNPGAVLKDGQVHLFPRCVGEYENYISRIGHLMSDNGFDFSWVSDHPIFQPKEHYEKWGCEDPRVTEIDGKFYMTYVALSSPHSPPKSILNHLKLPKIIIFRLVIPRTALASTEDFIHFRKHGLIDPLDISCKDTVIFPDKKNDKFFVIKRIFNWMGPGYNTSKPSMWIFYTYDFNKFYEPKLLMRPEQIWEGSKIGTGPPPIETREGWLLIYHGVDENHVYRISVALLDLKDPTKVIARSPIPILEPEKNYEVSGDMPNIIFPTGAVVIDDKIFLYCGTADKYCSLYTADLDDVLNHVLEYKIE